MHNYIITISLLLAVVGPLVSTIIFIYFSEKKDSKILFHYLMHVISYILFFDKICGLFNIKTLRILLYIIISFFALKYFLSHSPIGTESHDIDNLIKIIPSAITAAAALYVGFKARSITKEQKELTEKKLIFDIHDKRKEFLTAADKVLQTVNKFMAAMATAQQSTQKNDIINKAKKFYNITDELNNKLLSLSEIRNINMVFYNYKQNNFIDYIVSTGDDMRKKLFDEYAKIIAGATAIDFNKSSNQQQIREVFCALLFNLREEINKNLEEILHPYL